MRKLSTDRSTPLESHRSVELAIRWGGFSIYDRMSTDPVDWGTWHIYFPHLFMSVLFMHFLISTPSLCTLHVYISLITASVGWYTVCIWAFVCVCCAAPDKLTSPPPFTGFGALHFGIRARLVQNLLPGVLHRAYPMVEYEYLRHPLWYDDTEWVTDEIVF